MFSHVATPVTAFAPRIDYSPMETFEAKVFAGSMSRAFFTGSLNVSEVEAIQSSARLMMERTKLESTWRGRILNPVLPASQSELTKTAKSVMEAIAKFGDEAIDLTILPADRINAKHLAVLLRATWTRKQATKGWKDALEATRTALANQGVNPDEALIGMVTTE